MNIVIETKRLTKTFQIGDVAVHALRGINLKVAKGDFVAIMGASGSGKSTLMNLLGCLDQPTSGEYFLDGINVQALSKMERFRNLFKAAFKSLLKDRMRSLLTSLGIIIGVGAVIVMVAVGQGSQAQIEEQITSLGTNLIMVFPSVSSTGGVSRGAGSFNRFTFADVEKLQEATLLSAVSPVVRSGGQIIGGSSNWNTAIYGVSPEYLTIRNWQLESGELFTERDLSARRNVALLGKTVADNLFQGEDAVGKKSAFATPPLPSSARFVPKDKAAWGKIKMTWFWPQPQRCCTGSKAGLTLI